MISLILTVSGASLHITCRGMKRDCSCLRVPRNDRTAALVNLQSSTASSEGQLKNAKNG